MIQRRTALGLAAACAALTVAGLTLSVGHASAAAPGDSSWGRSGAYCYQNPPDQSNPVRYHITNIAGSPKEGIVTFDRTLERWDEATNTYTVVNTPHGWKQAIGENLSYAIDSFNMGDAGRACSDNFTLYPVESQPYAGFSYGPWA